MYVTGNLWIDFLMDVTGNLCFFHGGCWEFMFFLLMDVAGSLWNCLWMLLEIYGFVHGCYWKFMDCFMYATGNLWIFI
jgi:hypothetical protein